MRGPSLPGPALGAHSLWLPQHLDPDLAPHGTDSPTAALDREGSVTPRPSSGLVQASFWASRSGNFFIGSAEDSSYSVCVLMTTCAKR